MFTQASHKIFHSLHDVYAQPLCLPEITESEAKKVSHNNNSTTSSPI